MRRLSTTLKLVLLALVFCVIVGSAQLLLSRARVDLTDNKLYTLSDGTQSILKNLKEPIKLRFTYSAQAAAGYPQIQLYAQQVNDLLDAFARKSGGKITIERINPEPFSDNEDIAMIGGLRGAPTNTGDTLYFGLEATNSSSDKSGRKIIPFFAPDREPQLEYDLINMVSQLSTPTKPKVALLTSLPMAFGPGGPMAAAQGASRPYVMYEQLRAQFQLTNLYSDFVVIAPDVRVLIIAHPAPLNAIQLYAIDQFVMRGGRLMVFVDPVSEMALTMQGSEAMLASASPPPIASDLQPLFAKWGVKLTEGQVAADGKFAQQVSMSAGEPIFYLPWIGVRSTAFAANDLTVQGLKQINLATSGVLELLPREGVTQEALYTTSDVAGLFDAAIFRGNPDPVTLIQNFKPTGAQYTLAARLTGRFESAFSGPPIPNITFLPKSVTPTSIIVVADTDLLSDPLWVNIGGNESTPVVQPIADNGAFFFNALDQSLGVNELLSLRSRRSAARPFILVQEKQFEAEQKLRIQQGALREKLESTQARIAQLEGAGGTSRQFQSKAQKAEIDGFRRNVVTTRKALREIQGKLRRSVDALETKIVAINIIAVPLLLLLVALGRTILRSRRMTKPV
jgi:ABC-type uncharacterized transport system involved in gliding motility auxiliary subunit